MWQKQKSVESEWQEEPNAIQLLTKSLKSHILNVAEQSTGNTGEGLREEYFRGEWDHLI